MGGVANWMNSPSLSLLSFTSNGSFLSSFISNAELGEGREKRRDRLGDGSRNGFDLFILDTLDLY